LIAANGGSNSITVFSVAANGALTPVAGSPFAAGGSSPDGIKVAPNGQFLSVALANSDMIGMFSIAANGVLTPVLGSPFASPAPGAVTGVDINCASTFLYAAQAGVGGTFVDVFSIGPNGVLTLVQTSNNPGVGDNSNVGVLSPNDQFLFVSNQLSNSVTAFSVAANGALSLVAGSPFFGTGGLPSGLATNAAGTLLFTANFGSSTVTSFSIAGNGALTPVGSFGTGLLGFSGLESLAAFPGKSCSTFDVCLQDDSNGNLLQINSTTGDYQFTNCSGFTLSGTGSLMKKGSVITLQHYAADRRVLARIDSSVNKGTASVQVFSQGTTFTITDRNTANNTCACAVT
jgi:6-phosphogluconolactonase (cycloisomerase 2 family)